MAVVSMKVANIIARSNHFLSARAKPIENLSQQEKKDIGENMLRMKQMFDKLDELLPVFLQMTSNVEATRRLILMKHLYDEQYKLLPQQTYIVSMDQLNLLGDQMQRYFRWVRTHVSGQQMGGMQQQQQQPGVSQPPSMVSQPATAATAVAQMAQAPQPQPPTATQAPPQQGQHHVPSPMPQQQQAVRPPVSMSQSPQQLAAEQVPTSNAMGIKRASIDLKLPPSKKQRAAANQQQQTPQQQSQEAAVSSPATSSSPATMLQSGQAPPAAMNSGPIPMNNVSPQELQQAALARGFPPELLRVLPDQALQCNWVLAQAEKKTLSLNPQSIDYLRKMLDMQVNAARRQLEQQQQNVTTTTESSQQQTPVPPPQQQRTPSVTSIRSSPAMTPAAASTPATNVATPVVPPASSSTPSMAAASRPATTPMTTPATIAATTCTPTTTVATTPTTLTTTPTTTAAAVSTPMMAATPISRPQLSTTSQQRPGMNAENKVVNTMMYANDVLKDVASILAQKTPDDAPEKIALNVMREGTHCAYAMDASPFKEGYKDETFSLALDRGLLGKNEMKDNEPDPSTDWYEPGMMDPGIIGMNEIMRGFEWDESGAMISS